jgi:hypothetical protein
MRINLGLAGWMNIRAHGTKSTLLFSVLLFNLSAELNFNQNRELH